MDLLSRTGGQPLVQDGMERTRDLAGDLPAAAAKHYSQVEVFSVGRPAYEAEVQMPPVLVPEPAAAAIKPPSRQNSARMWIDEMLENTTATHGAAATSQSPVQLFSALGRARSLAPQLPVTPTLPPIHGNGHVQMEELLKDVLGGEDSANPPKTQDTEDALNAMMQDLGAAMQGPSQPPFPAAKASPFGANQTIGTQVHWQDDPTGPLTSPWKSSSVPCNPGRMSDTGMIHTASTTFWARRAASNSFKHVSSSLVDGVMTLVVGDDHRIQDKWDTLIDGGKHGKSGKIMPTNLAGKPGLPPKHPSQGSGCSSISGLPVRTLSRTKSGVPYIELLNEQRSGRLLMWHHMQTLCFSFFVAAVCLPLVGLVSMASWSYRRTPEEVQALTKSTGMQQSVIVPNGGALQVLLLFQLVFPLALYGLLLYVCVTRSLRIPKGLFLFVLGSITWACIVSGLFYHFGTPFWFYYVDIFMIVLVYVPCMCVAGWYIESDPDAPWKTRLNDLMFIAILETLVAASALLYCMFLMPVFFQITSSWGQMAWLCIAHPLYFEVTTGYIVRKALFRNIQLGRTHIAYFLTIVHSLVHSVALATTLQASLEPLKIMAVTVVLYCLSKFIWRSTVIARDLFIERLRHGWSFNFPESDRAELGRMVAVGVMTEMVLDNASAIITPFLLYRMFDEPIFMSVVPNSFFNANGKASAGYVAVLVVILFSFTVLFDITFLFTNYFMWQRLPLINTWRRIKNAQGWYLFFVTYAFATMGIFFLFLTMVLMPRATFCKSNNYCDCYLLAYKTVCEGEFISLLSDYLIDVN